MFTDMGVPVDAAALDRAFRRWLVDMMPSGRYRAWVVEDQPASIVAGGGATFLPWPPGPRSMTTELAFVYNVYVDSAHRRRGLARQIMEAIHACCRRRGVTTVALNASRDGLPLYEQMGYTPAPAPMMFFAVPFDQQV